MTVKLLTEQHLEFLSLKGGCTGSGVSGTHRNTILSYDIVSGSEIMPCNKINKLLVVYIFSGNVMKQCF